MNEVDEVKAEKEHKITAKPANGQLPMWFPWVAAGLGALLIACLGYAAGSHVGRSDGYVRNGFSGMMRGDLDDRRASGMGNRGRGMMGGGIGEVTAVGVDSITLKDTIRGGSVTYKIDSNTKVTENGTTKAVGDIKTGSTVKVVATGADTTIATAIAITTN